MATTSTASAEATPDLPIEQAGIDNDTVDHAWVDRRYQGGNLIHDCSTVYSRYLEGTCTHF